MSESDGEGDVKSKEEVKEANGEQQRVHRKKGKQTSKS